MAVSQLDKVRGLSIQNVPPVSGHREITSNLGSDEHMSCSTISRLKSSHAKFGESTLRLLKRT